MTVHDLKIWPEQYQKVVNGHLSFQYRENDRNYQMGDVLILNEWNPKKNEFTGRKMCARVKYVFDEMNHGDVPVIIMPGYCVMSIDPIYNHNYLQKVSHEQKG